MLPSMFINLGLRIVVYFILYFSSSSGQYSLIVREGSAPVVDRDHAAYKIEEYVALKVSAAVFIKFTFSISLLHHSIH